MKRSVKLELLGVKETSSVYIAEDYYQIQSVTANTKPVLEKNNYSIL